MESKFDRVFKAGLDFEVDPVCGMSVDPGNPPGGSHEYEGTIYFFCADSCRVKFSENPTYILKNFGQHSH